MTRLYLVALFVCAAAACGSIGKPSDDVCDDGVCECTAATEVTDCGAHEFCNESDTGKLCECAAGYTDGVNGCVWTGAVQDPAFTSMTTWTPANGALINTTAVGGIDAGEAAFLPSALCAHGQVKQTFDMPTFAKSEPLVLELSYKNPITRSQQGFTERALMGVSFGGVGWSPFPAYNDALFHSTRICLPGGGYAPPATAGKGAPVTLAFGPYQPATGCPNTAITNFAIDHAAIVVANAGECGKEPGLGLNYDAEGAGGWTFSVTGQSFGRFGTTGDMGSRAVELGLTLRCEGASMSTYFTVPAVANPALEWYAAGNATARATARLGPGLFTMTGPPRGGSQLTRTCLPPSLRGQTMSLGFDLNGGTGVCADVVSQLLSVDNVRVVEDPACATNDNFANGGFEHGGAPFAAYGTDSTSTSEVVVRGEPGLARTGSKYLQMQSFGRCTSSTFVMTPTVPAAVGASGPALKFYASVGVNPDASSSVFTQGSTSQTLVEGGGYQPYTVCLNPTFVGRPQTVTLSQYGGSGLCDNSNYIPQSTLIDDIEVTTDPNCPATLPVP